MQVVDWDGKLGYKYRGLMNEAINLSPRRGHGVAKWLPWLSVAVLDPMVRMKEAFGTLNVTQVQRLPYKERVRRAFGQGPNDIR